MFIQSAETLATLLQDASTAHHVYETELGHADANWPSWYAAYIWETLQSQERVYRALISSVPMVENYY